MSLIFKNYFSVSNYVSREEDIFASSYVINKYTLIRSAIMVGLASKGYLELSREVKEWKIKTIDVFVDTSTKPFKIKRKNIE
ncbi:hypothetical protein C0971_01955 [Bacillus methanolicus]|uniref:hypothetical protein n=1 Tax=Bacillus methanolicus TaxID=1471 RepID=UPI00200CA3B1|nr:hypothetical protein [Bacillus methanolicus]UQD50943.1 hypothetical protein C0971_01955 [Bacillus methanolicus]